MKTHLFSTIVLLTFAGCNTNTGFTKGPGDLWYQKHIDKAGPTVQNGEMLAISATERTESDSLIATTYSKDGRSMITVRSASYFDGDLNAAYGLLSQGDSVTFKINIDSIIKHQQRADLVNIEGKYILYTIKVDTVVARGAISDSVYTTMYEKLRYELAGREKNKEAGKIRAFINDHNLKPIQTASGLQYVITKQGAGKTASPGDTVYVDYTARFLSGEPYMTTSALVAKAAKIPKFATLHTQVGRGKSIAGIEEALMLFPKGTKAIVIIPSKLGYGADFHEGVEPYTPQTFDIEIQDIISQGGNFAGKKPGVNYKH